MPSIPSLFLLYSFSINTCTGERGWSVFPHAVRSAQTFRDLIGPLLPDAKTSGRISRNCHGLLFVRQTITAFVHAKSAYLRAGIYSIPSPRISVLRFFASLRMTRGLLLSYHLHGIELPDFEACKPRGYDCYEHDTCYCSQHVHERDIKTNFLDAETGEYRFYSEGSY